MGLVVIAVVMHGDAGEISVYAGVWVGIECVGQSIQHIVLMGLYLPIGIGFYFEVVVGVIGVSADCRCLTGGAGVVHDTSAIYYIVFVGSLIAVGIGVAEWVVLSIPSMMADLVLGVVYVYQAIKFIVAVLPAVLLGAGFFNLVVV